MLDKQRSTQVRTVRNSPVVEPRAGLSGSTGKGDRQPAVCTTVLARNEQLEEGNGYDASRCPHTYTARSLYLSDPLPGAVVTAGTKHTELWQQTDSDFTVGHRQCLVSDENSAW